MPALHHRVEGQAEGMHGTQGMVEIATTIAHPTRTGTGVARQVSPLTLFFVCQIDVARPYLDQIAGEIANADARDRRPTSTATPLLIACHEMTITARAAETTEIRIANDAARPRSQRPSIDTYPAWLSPPHLNFS
jgi:hypothetical protein